MMIPAWLEYTIFWGFWILLILVVVLLGLLMVNEVAWLPKEAKILRKAKRKRKTVMIVGNDDGSLEFETEKQLLAEGIVETNTGKIFFLPRPWKKPEVEDVEEGVWDQVKKLVTKKFILKSVGVPVWLAYAGTTIAGNPKMLANLEYGPAQSQSQATKSFNVGGKPVTFLFPVDVRTLYAVRPFTWPQSLWKATKREIEVNTMLKLKKFHGGLKEYMPFMIIALLIIAIIVLGALLLG